MRTQLNLRECSLSRLLLLCAPFLGALLFVLMAGSPVAAQSYFPCESLSSSPATASQTRLHPFDDPCIDEEDVKQEVVRILYRDEESLTELLTNYDVWELDREASTVVALVSLSEKHRLTKGKFEFSRDEEKSSALPRPVETSGTDSIPGFACYRTVEETYDDLSGLAAANPTLATWIDIGDSYDRTVSGPGSGYDIYALKLTSTQIEPAKKGKLIVLAAVHARELATAELATRFAEMMVGGYGTDPRITWLLDFNEIHLIPLGNPDGRKWAEAGHLWRKNTDRPTQCSFPNYGVDINRNSSFRWNACGISGCSSGNPCSSTYRGAAPTSEPETAAIENYLRTVFADQKGPAESDPAPADTNGVFLSLHSYGRLILFTWDWSTSPAPNRDELRRLGRKFGHLTGYSVCATQTCLYPIEGSNTDFAYGELGVASFTFEIGTSFFQSCSYFENTILQKNLEAMLYAASVARRPYQLPGGPDVVDLELGSSQIEAGDPLLIKATADDSRTDSNGFGSEPTQPIAAVRYSLDLPTWLARDAWLLPPADEAFNSVEEAISHTLDTSAWTEGRHTIFVEAQDAQGNWGPPSAIFINVETQSGLSLQQEPASVLAAPGKSAYYTLTLTNTGSTTMTYQLALEQSSWPVTPQSESWALEAGASRVVPISVQVPLSASVGASHVTIVRISAPSDPKLLRMATLETVVAPRTDPASFPNQTFLPQIGRE